MDAQSKNWIDCTGDVVTGDTIRFTEAVFSGSHRKPKFRGNREIVANVVKDSYGEKKQQHTFTIVVIESSKFDPLETGTKTTRTDFSLFGNFGNV